MVTEFADGLKGWTSACNVNVLQLSGSDDSVSMEKQENVKINILFSSFHAAWVETQLLPHKSSPCHL